MNNPFRVSLLIDGDASDANAALKSVSSEAQKTAKSTEKLGPAGKTAATGMAAAGKASISMANSGRMVTQQLSQVVQQSVATGNVMQSFAIQAADIGLAFGTIGTVVGIAASIALPALMAAFGKTGKAADDANADIIDLKSALTALDDLAKVSAGTLDVYLNRAFRESAGSVRELLGELQNARFDAGTAEVRASVAGLSDEVDRYIGAWEFANKVGMETLEATAAEGGFGSMSRDFLQLIEDANASEAELRALKRAVDAVGDARNMTEFTARLADARSLAEAMGGTLSDEVVTALTQAAGQAGILETTTADAATVTKAATTNADGLEAAIINAATAAKELLAPFPALQSYLDSVIGKAGALASAFSAAAANAAAMAQAEASAAANREAQVVAAANLSDETGVAANGSGPLVPTVLSQGQIQAAMERARLDAERAARRPGGGGGGGSAATEADAVQELIKSLEEEIALARETDPVQKELLRNREALAGATDEERAAVEELIRTRMEEERAAAAAAESSDFFAQTAYDALEGLILQGDSLSDVFDNLAMAIAQAALQAALLGTGPLAGIFGMGDSGGALGMIFGSLFGQAEGGMVYGPGTGTSDSVPRRLSNGEFVVNAAATQRNRHALEAINSGQDVPGLASGGYVGPPANLAGAPVGGAVPVNITIENRSSAQVEGQVEETTTPSGQRSMRLVLADQVGAALTQPGGGAKKVMGSRYGIRQRGTRR